MDSAAREALKEAGLTGEFAIATACNPRGVVLAEAENRQRQHELESALTAPFTRVNACSPDRSHCEPSVAFAGLLNDALALARHWEQLAIFWWDGEKFWIHGALADAYPVPLPPPRKWEGACR